MQRELDKEFEGIVRDRLACLALLLSQNILEIKLAVTKEIRRQGSDREKLGIFGDNSWRSGFFRNRFREHPDGEAVPVG
ncbi:MAG: hypothetical protein ACM65L_22375 [Microcoleus sp.]